MWNVVKWIRFDVENQIEEVLLQCKRKNKTNSNNKAANINDDKQTKKLKEDKKNIFFFNLFTELRKWAYFCLKDTGAEERLE